MLKIRWTWTKQEEGAARIILEQRANSILSRIIVRQTIFCIAFVNIWDELYFDSLALLPYSFSTNLSKYKGIVFKHTSQTVQWRSIPFLLISVQCNNSGIWNLVICGGINGLTPTSFYKLVNKAAVARVSALLLTWRNIAWRIWCFLSIQLTKNND